MVPIVRMPHARGSRHWATLSLDIDGQGFLEIGRRDPVIGKLQADYRNLRPVLFHSP